MRFKKGFTLMEILLVVAILAVLTIALTFSLRKQKTKADDARVKTDLELLKIAFENYYADNNCYPPATWFDSPDDCGSSNLQPYLGSIPCDKKTEMPYTLEYYPNATSQCGGFKLYGWLQNTDDPQVQALADDNGSTAGNYGVSSGNTSVTVLVPKPGQPLPPTHSYYWCSGTNNCSSFDPATTICTPYFTDDVNCGGTGGSKCPTAGSCSTL